MTLNNWCLFLLTGIPIASTNYTKGKVLMAEMKFLKYLHGTKGNGLTFNDKNSYYENKWQQMQCVYFYGQTFFYTQMIPKMGFFYRTGIPITNTNGIKGNA